MADSKLITFAVVGLLIGAAAGVGIGFAVFNKPAEKSADMYFYFYDNYEYESLYKTNTASSYTGFTVNKIYTKAGDVYTEFGGNPYTGENLNADYYFLYAENVYVKILALSYYDAVNYMYVKLTESTWTAHPLAEGLFADYISPTPFKNLDNAINKGIWVKGHGSTTLDCFKDACERAGYKVTFKEGTSYISDLNGVKDGNFCVMFYIEDKWTTTKGTENLSLDSNDVSKYVAIGHGAWDSAMFVAPQPGVTPSDDIIAL